MNFCIPKELSKRLRDAARDGEFSIASLYDLSSKDRRELFSKYTDPTLGRQINAEFEKVMVSTQKQALSKWVEDTFSTEQKKSPAYGSIREQIDSLDELGVLGTESGPFLEDLVAQKLGLTLSAEEVQTIRGKAAKLEELYKEVDALGDPSDARDAQVTYLQALEDTNNYVRSLAPHSNVKVATSVIGRGNLLFRISSPVINIVSNTFWGSYQFVERRLVTGSVGGLNSDFARSYVGFALEMHQKSGFDLTRMIALEDEQKIRGEKITTSQGPGAIRKVGRFYEDIVFKQMMGAPDVLGAAIAFADSANIESTLIAVRKEGLKREAAKKRALEIFQDATRVDPLTLEGVVVREKAIADAQLATFTNDTTYSRVALGIRELINKAGGDVSLGDQLMPFVKTPANIIGAVVDVSGAVTLPEFFIRGLRTIHDTYKGQKLTEATRHEFQGFSRKAVRAGLGLTLALILSAMFDPEDFIGEFDQKEKALNDLKRGVNNAVKIGDKWVSLDYFGPIAAGFVGIMYARKYGGNLAQTAFQYYRGAATQVLNLPGFDAAQTVIDTVGDLASGKTKVNEIPAEASAGAINFVGSRLIPGIVSDFAKMTDDYERQTKGEGVWARFKSRTPFLRQELPISKDVLGEAIHTPPALSQLLFGSRVRIGQDSPIVSELDRLSQSGNLPTLTKVEETSTRFPKLREQKGQVVYERTLESFHGKFKAELARLIKTPRYERLSDEEKKNEINNLKGRVLDQELKRAGYRK
jgi:hypothetical protein